MSEGTHAYAYTQEQLAELFTEWERRYREEPAKFMSDVERYTVTTPATYGDLCAAYFLGLGKDIFGPFAATATAVVGEPA